MINTQNANDINIQMWELDKTECKTVLEGLGEQFEKPTAAYCFGSSDMLFLGHRDSCGDIDLFVESETVLHRFGEVLYEAGFIMKNDFNDASLSRAYHTSHFNYEGVSVKLDVTVRLPSGITLSEPMRDRSIKLLESGYLTVYLLSEESLFFNELYTTRPTNVDKLSFLIQAGLDAETIESEFHTQDKLVNKKIAVPQLWKILKSVCID